MATVTVTDSKLEAIADAIRDKKSISITMTLDEMASQISSIDLSNFTETYLKVSSDGGGEIVVNPTMNDMKIGDVVLLRICWYTKIIMNAPSVAYVYLPSNGTYEVKNVEGTSTAVETKQGGDYWSKEITYASGSTRNLIDYQVFLVKRVS